MQLKMYLRYPELEFGYLGVGKDEEPAFATDLFFASVNTV